MTGPYQTILTDAPAPHVLRVTLNRPDVANAFNTQMMRELSALWTGIMLVMSDPRGGLPPGKELEELQRVRQIRLAVGMVTVAP